MNPLRYHAEQQRLWRESRRTRFCAISAGRRSGKTELAKRHIARCCFTPPNPVARYAVCAPTHAQAKAIWWDDLVAYLAAIRIPAGVGEPPHIVTATGAEVHVLGLDRPERIEGRPWDGVIITEVANCRRQAWFAHVRPALADRGGWAWLEGVPEGRNWFWSDVVQPIQEGRTGDDWGHYAWHSESVLPPDEIATMKRDLDPLLYAQEAGGEFVSFSGRAYHCYDPATHCRSLTYDPAALLCLCFDFNISPGVAAIVQETPAGTSVIGEVWIPQNSNTVQVCRRIADDWGTHPGPVTCFGDATGGAGGTAQTRGSDWAIIEQELRPVFGDRLAFAVPAANPRQRSRMNAVNARLRNAAGDVRLLVDGAKAPHVAADLDAVRLAEDGTIEQKPGTDLTHISDALGYYVYACWPVAAAAVPAEQLRYGV